MKQQKYTIRLTVDNIDEFILYVKQNKLFNFSDEKVLEQIKKFPFIVTQETIS